MSEERVSEEDVGVFGGIFFRDVRRFWGVEGRFESLGGRIGLGVSFFC